ncbi:hypothetical protein AB0C89_29805 [Streptomyces sp. NPDC048491]|uniref:hypothetical protein n=1 Tax=Streptomyces sp. NPDC048491 TaxID=3157207 RepID=UPI0034349A51
MPAARTIRRLAVFTGMIATCGAVSAAPAAASENILGIGNAAFNNTMINANKQVTAVAHTAQGSGVLNNLNQLPVDLPRNGGAGGSMCVYGFELVNGVCQEIF